jgi:shikimate dehydrogenase
MTDRYAVVGNPVDHSLSPEIHAAFARQTRQAIDYGKLLAPLDGFAAAVEKFRADGGKGLNVTVPFKFEAFSLCNHPGPEASDAEAVNTLDFRDGKIFGYNTDGIGLVTDLENGLGFRVRDKRVLILGAGGVTSGVMHPLLSAHPRHLVVANRTLDRARSLVARFARNERFALTKITATPYEALDANFDLVINATSAGLRNEMPALPEGIFAAGALAYDMVYGKRTPFMAFAQQQGARTSDGLGMLAEQAAAAFEIWRGVRPQTQPVIEMLRTRTVRP